MRMWDQVKRKLKSSKAFTLAEMLLAVLILLMVTAIVAAGIPVAKNAYEKVVLSSNAEVLLSTTISTLRNELGTARDVEVLPTTAAGTRVTYYNPSRSAYASIYLSEDAKKEIMFQRYYKKDDLSKEYAPVPLVSSKTATADLYVTYASVSYADGVLTFSNLSVNRASGTTGLALRGSLSIRVISE